MLVKICGVTRLEDVSWLDGLVDYIGFIVEPTSPRSVPPTLLPQLAKAVKSSRPVLVTATLPVEEAARMAAEAGIPVLQHHGISAEEEAEAVWKHGVAVAPVAVYRGGPLRPQVERLLRWRHEYVLVDGDKKSAMAYEGGLKIPLDVLREVARLGKVALAGGITPDNAGLVASLNPYMVDVASGVESAPGVKDRAKVTALLRALGRL